MRLHAAIPIAVPTLTLVLASLLPAQVAPGFAVVAWKPPGGGAGGLKLVDRTGASTDIQGLDPLTIGSSVFDGARSVLVDDGGVIYVGLGLDNRRSATPRPLDLRRIVVNGSVAVSDQPFSTVLAVPAGEVWHLADLAAMPDGGILVGATETVFTANPMPQTAAFVVDPAGVPATLPSASFPAGSLRAVAVAGDRWVGAFEQSFFVVNVELVSFPLGANGTPPFRVLQLVNVASFGGLGVDVDGTLLVGAASSLGAGSVVRVSHAPNATPSLVAGSPSGVTQCAVIPAAGLVAVVALPRNPLAPLVLVDTLAGGATPWSAGLALEPEDLAVRANPARYGSASPAAAIEPYLGTFGGLPYAGNARFGFRVGGTPGSIGVLLLGVARAQVPTPFGLLLLDPTQALVQLAPLSLGAVGVVQIPVPLAASLRGRVDLQAVLFPSVTPAVGEMTAGLEVSFQ